MQCPVFHGLTLSLFTLHLLGPQSGAFGADGTTSRATTQLREGLGFLPGVQRTSGSQNVFASLPGLSWNTCYPGPDAGQHP